MNKGRASCVWHPFAQHAITPDFPEIARAEGAYLFDVAGNRIIDAISSWWVITYGHCHPRITAAIKSAADRLDQIIFANYTHSYAEELAEELVRITPAGLDHVFYTDSGSTSIEVALKMALGYWQNIGRPRHRVLVLEHGYHGDTVGAMSAGERGVFNSSYAPLLFEVETIPYPRAGSHQDTYDALERACSVEPKAAAFLLEPLVLGAGGMHMYSTEVLKEMRRICAEHDVLFIADEVMTGWGRLGAPFACNLAGIAPDIACFGKGLTGGALPLAVTMCQSRIFDAHWSMDRTKTFFHSSSFTANPIACAAALESMRIWQDEEVLETVGGLSALQGDFLTGLADSCKIENPRQTGTITAFDVAVSDAGYLADIGPRMMRAFLDRGILLRPLGSTVYVMPPYCVTREDLSEIYAAIETVLCDLATGSLKQ